MWSGVVLEGYNGGTPTFSNISLSDIFRINIGDQLQTTWNPGYTSQGLRIGTTHILCGSFVGKIYTASLNSSCFTGTTIATRILKDDLNNWDDAFQWAFDNANSYIEIKEVYTISGWKICGCAMTADGQKMVIVESGEEGRAAYSFDAGSTWNSPKWWRWTTGGVGWESTQGTASNGASNSEKNRFVQTSDDGKYVFIGSLYAKITETTAGTWISNDYGENFYSYKDLTSNSEGIALSVAGASWNGSSSPFSDISTNNFLSIANIGGTDHANNIKSYPPTILLTPENVFTNNIQNNNEFRDAIILISKGFDPSDGTTALTTKADRRTKYKSQFKGRNKDHFGGTTLKEKLLTLKNSILAMIQDSFEDDDTDDSKFIEIDEFNGRAAGKLTAVLKPANAQDGTLEIAKEKAVYLPGTGKWRRNITKARIRIIEKDDETDKFRLILSDAPDENGYPVFKLVPIQNISQILIVRTYL